MEKSLLLLLFALFICGCEEPIDSIPIINNTNNISLEEAPEVTYFQGKNISNQVELHIKDEFQEPFKLPLANLGWEDGLHLSDDALSLYATYIPADMLSFVLNQDDVSNYELYHRGPIFEGSDFSKNPVNANYPWYHSEIIASFRDSIDEPFSQWELYEVSRPIFSEGAPITVFDERNQKEEYFLFTSNDKDPTYDVDIWSKEFDTKDFGSPLVDINTIYNEDNPDVNKISENHLILFFDSDNRPLSQGMHDIWFSESLDNGKSWSEPRNDLSINSNQKEHQPHLFISEENTYLYYSKYDSTNKLAIYRSKQVEEGNWLQWTDEELVVSAKNAEGIGEPTVAQNGDLSFVVVSKKDSETQLDIYDADPWYLKSK